MKARTNKIFLFTTILCFSGLQMSAQEDTEFNSLFRQEIGGWIAADATYSVVLPDGRTLWLFGDTFIGQTEGTKIVPGSVFIRNSAVIQNGSSLQTLYSGSLEDPDDFIKTPFPDSTWYWPEHGIVDNDTLRIILSEFRYSDEGNEGFNFEQIGNDIACFSFPDLEFIYARQIESYERNQVIYGDRILKDSNYLYIYGRKEDPANFNIPYPHVARAAVNNLMDEASWQYFDGNNWSSEATSTHPINNFQVSQQYSVSTYQGKYILLTQDIWLSPVIWTFVSDSPTGPWKNKTKIFTTPETSGSTFTYNAYAHPQFDKDGKMLISYNVNGDFWSIFNDVEIYRPRFIRIPYMNMSFDFWTNNTENIRNTILQEFCIFPNPVSDQLFLYTNTGINGSLSYSIINLDGRTIMEDKIELLPGAEQVSIPAETIPEGYYMLKIDFKGRSELLSFIKI